MEKKRNSRVGIISFVLAVLPIIYMIIQGFIDIYMDTDFHKVAVFTYIILNYVYAMCIVSFTLGIIAIRKKGYKKVLPIIALIISSLMLLIPIVTSIKLAIKTINM